MLIVPALTFNQTQAPAPRPVRNDTPKPVRELLVLRNHQLRKGGHEPFYAFSRDGLWPYFERIGARVVGQWKVITEAAAAPDREDVYRLVRYASFEHWLATRSGSGNPLGGDGPAWQKGQAGLNDRADLEIGSAGAYFLEGSTTTGAPSFLPALAGQYRLVEAGERPPATDAEIPVRVDVARPGQEIVELRHQRIRKGTFDAFLSATMTSVWPFEEKLGARPIGQWQVVYPDNAGGAPIRTARGGAGLLFLTPSSAEYDQVVTLTRFASAAHRDALSTYEKAMYEGGNGPDWLAWKTALERQRAMILLSRADVLQGFMYQSPPMYLPGLPERYQRIR